MLFVRYSPSRIAPTQLPRSRSVPIPQYSRPDLTWHEMTFMTCYPVEDQTLITMSAHVWKLPVPDEEELSRRGPKGYLIVSGPYLIAAQNRRTNVAAKV